MNIGVWIGLAGLLVAVVSIGATILAARRWGNRRKRIAFSWEAARLLPVGRSERLLEVTFRDIPVTDPHLVTVRVANVGPLDIASKHFDAGRSLVVNLNCMMYGLTHSSHPSGTVTGAIGSDGVVELRPVLLRRGEEWAVEAVVGGEPKPTLDSPLVDTDLVEGPSAVELFAEQFADVIVSVALPFGLELRVNR